VSVEQPIRKFSKLLGTFVLESKRTQGARVRKSFSLPQGGWSKDRLIAGLRVGRRIARVLCRVVFHSESEAL
jgi:hypothetical protein